MKEADPRPDDGAATAPGDEARDHSVSPPAGPPVTAFAPGERRRPPRQSASRRRLSVALLVMLVLAVLAGGTALLSSLGLHQGNPASTPTPAASNFQAAACPFKPAPGMAEGRDVRCGYLIVPEDRTLAQSPSIRLAVALFKTPNPHPAPDPVIDLNGGPGDPLLRYLGPTTTTQSLSSWPANRDLILLDQRGTGYSQPSLDCPEVSAFQVDTLDQRLSRDTKGALYAQAARTCHDRLVREGVNLSAYNTIENAADVHDLVRALGYQRVNLRTGSYSTRLALTMMRLFPSDLRSALLDAVYPPQVNGFTGWPDAAGRAFDVLFQGCARDQACNKAYPHLQAVFARLVVELNATPITFQVTIPQTGASHRVLFSGDDLVMGVRGALYQTSLIPRLPAVIFQIRDRDYTHLSQLYSELAFSEESMGMYYSVECGENMALATPQALAASVQTLDTEIQPYFLASLKRDYQVCQGWGAKSVPAAQKQPVTSAVPALILAGEYDPDIPPAYGEMAAQTLSRGYFFLFPGVGHGVQFTSTCADSIVLAFQEHPDTRPDASCVAQLGEPRFE